MCEDIGHIGRDMPQNRIFGNGETFCPSLDNFVKATRL